jgi:hypothetical protein
MKEADMPDLPPEIDTSRPHAARIYDYFLGGKNHFAADRDVAEKSLASIPSGRVGAREQRAFLGRAVRYLAGEAGIRQFLDIGTGLPTADNVHEVAQAIVPFARVVYVDNDPLVLAHARALLTSSAEGRTAYIHADLRSPDEILSSPVVQEMAGGVTVQARDSSELAALAFRGLKLAPPGVVSVSEWRPESAGPRPTLAEVNCYGGVGYKP